MIPRGILEVSARVGHMLLCALAGALLLYLLMPQPPAELYELPRVHVSPAAMQQLEPDAKVGIVERAVRPPRKLEQRVTADDAGQDLLEAFMASAEASLVPALIPDSLQVASPVCTDAYPCTPVPIDAPPRLAFAYAGTWTRSRLELFTITSDAAKERLTYRVCPNGSFVMTGDSALVQGPRVCWLPDVAVAVGVAALTYGIVEGDPYAIGGGILSLAIRKYLLK